SLYYSSRVESLRALHPGLPFLKEASDSTRLIVSEPLGDLPGVWNKVPEGSYGVVQPEGDDLLPFAPLPA
ncbi:class II glutamine amidotransferase, partial [Streptomyces sp. SID5926]|nr:class II glutamine amidotransferase [Streptomyces sp. SID5926]